MPATEPPDGSPSPSAPVRAVLLALAGLYAFLVPAHLLFLTGRAQQVMPPVAAATSLLLLGLWAVSRRRTSRAVVPLAGLAAASNCLVHIWAAGDLTQTAALCLVVIGLGATVAAARLLWVLLAVVVSAWAGVVAVSARTVADVDLTRAAWQLAMATVLSLLLHVAWQRRAQQLERSAAVLRERNDELLRARDELAWSEQRFRGAFDASPVGIGLADEHGRFVAANPALCELMGSRDLVGRSSLDFGHPDELAAHGQAQLLIDASPTGVARMEMRYVRADGAVRWAALTVTHVRGPEQQTWTLAHVQDVTERRAAEQELRDSEAALRAVSVVSKRIRQREDARRTIVASACDLTGCHSAALCEPAHDGLHVTASHGANLLGIRLGPDDSLHATALRSGLPQHGVADDLRHGPEGALLEQAGARSLLCQPLLVRGAVLGTLTLLWQDESAPSVQARRALALLADEAALALDHERLVNELRATAVTDPLTGLPNRRAWDTALVAALEHGRATRRPVAVAILDLDEFKAYNDSRGHPAGDALLRRFAHAATPALRPGDVVARWGGEEFALLLAGADLPAATAAVERLRALVPDGQTCSAGLCVWDGQETADELVGRADLALYDAKRSGRNRLRTGAPVSRILTAVPHQERGDVGSMGASPA